MRIDQNNPSSRSALASLEHLIETGGYAPGDRLPPERELIVQLGISRSNLRKALDALERRGTIWRHVGKGTFVSGVNAGTNDFPGLAVISRSVTPNQMIRARLALEPAIAREAALNADADGLVKIRRACDSAAAANSWDTYETRDDLLHRRITEATGNVLLLSLSEHLTQVRRAVSWQKVIRTTDCPAPDHPSFAEHEQIVAAIEARDSAGAFNAMLKHIKSVSDRLYGEP